jgi:hypothetical protein
MQLTSLEEIPSGHLGNISEEQEVCLKQMWAAILVISGKCHALPKGADISTIDISESFTIVKEIGAEQFHSTLWASPASEHPDVLVLRFLRARDWDVGGGKTTESLVT